MARQSRHIGFHHWIAAVIDAHCPSISLACSVKSWSDYMHGLHGCNNGSV